MIPTTKEKLSEALSETARVLNLILNTAPPPEPLFSRARFAYDKATEAMRDEGRDKFVRDMNTPIEITTERKP